MPGEALRVKLDMTRPWNFQPGQHVYLYVPSVGLWTSHPFTVAWSEEKELESASIEKGLAKTQQDVLALSKSTFYLLIRRRTGFTDSLYKKAEKAPNGQITVRAFVEGPYGEFSTPFFSHC
jgi:hypothetical protein